ncbi:MAG: hypothetical protein ABEI13_00220, partial [Candidatus Paceibacteria bacterium]
MSLTGDSFVHIGRTKYILDAGHFGQNNIYPGLHMISASLKLITEIDLYQVLILFVVFGSLTSMFIFILIGKNIDCVSEYSGAVILVFFIIILDRNLYHFASWGKFHKIVLAIYILITVWYANNTINNRQAHILAIIFGISATFLHILLVVPTLLYFSFWIVKSRIYKKTEFPLLKSSGIGLIAILSGYWILNFPAMKFFIRRSVLPLL